MPKNVVNRKTAPVALIAALLCCTSLQAQDAAPLPEYLLTARSACVVNQSGDLKAYDNFYKEIKKWDWFEILPCERADVVLTLSSGSKGDVIIFPIVAKSNALGLIVLNAATSEVLWTDTTEKWVTSGHAPAKLVSNLRKRMPISRPAALSVVRPPASPVEPAATVKTPSTVPLADLMAQRLGISVEEARAKLLAASPGEVEGRLKLFGPPPTPSPQPR